MDQGIPPGTHTPYPEIQNSRVSFPHIIIIISFIMIREGTSWACMTHGRTSWACDAYFVVCAWLSLVFTCMQLHLEIDKDLQLSQTMGLRCGINTIFVALNSSYLLAYWHFKVPAAMTHQCGVALYLLGYAVFAVLAVVHVEQLYLAGSVLFLAGSISIGTRVVSVSLFVSLSRTNSHPPHQITTPPQNKPATCHLIDSCTPTVLGRSVESSGEQFS